MTESRLSIVKVLDRVVHIRISSEVGDKVIPFGILSSLGPVPMVFQVLFGKIEVSIGNADINILRSEIWDEIVFLEASFLILW